MNLRTVWASAAALLLVCMGIGISGCDTHENPYLLNPPAPDSTQIRVANLITDSPVSMNIGAVQVAGSVAPFQVSNYFSLLFSSQVALEFTHGTKHDTLGNQVLSAGSKITYFVLGRSDSAFILRGETGKTELQQMTAAGNGRISFLNAISDTSMYYIRVGCQSGDTLFQPASFATLNQHDTGTADLSLFLERAGDSLPIASARVTITPGQSQYLIATKVNGQIMLSLLSPSDVALRNAVPETRTSATMQVLNALSDGSSISASIAGAGISLAQGLSHLQISPGSAVPACLGSSGDSLAIIAAGGTPLDTSVKADVGGTTLIAAYGSGTGTHAVSMRLDPPASVSGFVYLRVVNLSSIVSGARVLFGAGAPGNVNGDSVAPTLAVATSGQVPRYNQLKAGSYPLLLQDATTGRFISGGVQNLANGFYTLFIVDNSGTPEMRLLEQNGGLVALTPLSQAGTRALFFNVMSDALASFTAGTVTLAPIAYSYTASTIIPQNTSSITLNGVASPVDATSGSIIIGATGSSSNQQVISFPSLTTSPQPGTATLRFLNAVPGAPPLNIFIDATTGSPVGTAAYGVPTQPFDSVARRYSFLITQPGLAAAGGGDSVVASSTGVEFTEGRRYVLIIGPARSGSATTTLYQTLWIQE